MTNPPNPPSSSAAIAALIESAAAAPVADIAPSEAFLQRAAAAARRAADVREMAAAAALTGFKPLPLPDYLAAIAASAKVSLSRVLPTVAGHFLESWVRLGRDIALPAERLRLLVRAFVAAREGPALAPVFARSGLGATGASFSSGDASEGEFVARLARIEATYPTETRERLADTLAALGL